MMFILPLVGFTLVSAQQRKEQGPDVEAHDFVAKLANVAFDHPLGQWVDPANVPLTDFSDGAMPDVDPWSWEDELEFENLYKALEAEAKERAQEELIRQFIRDGNLPEKAPISMVADALGWVAADAEEDGSGDVETAPVGGSDGEMPNDLLALLRTQLEAYDAAKRALEPLEVAVESEFFVAQELWQKRITALGIHGWQPALVPPATAQLSDDSGLLAPPQSGFVETNGVVYAEDGAGLRRRLSNPPLSGGGGPYYYASQYSGPHAPANCNAPGCHVGRKHAFGGNGGGWCNLCNR